MSTKEQTPIGVTGATRRFGSFTAVAGADLTVASGEVVGLLGANGAGKTTLIKLILGLLAPTAGTIRLFGAAPGIEQRRRIGYVPQNLGLYQDLTVGENLAFRSEVFSGRSATVGAVEGAAAGLDRLVGDLPLGEQRKAAFQAALQHQPDLLVLDEPTSGVSPLARSNLWDLIRSEADRGVGVLVSTHYMDEAVQADRLVVMTRGRIVPGETVADIVGERQTLVVDTDQWAEAFAVLDTAGRRPLLAGRTIRLPLEPGAGTDGGGDGAEIRRLLDRAGIGVETRTEPATLEEAMVELSA